MQYAKHLKAYPLPELTPKQHAEADRLIKSNKISDRKYSNLCQLYSAQLNGGVLDVVLYDVKNGKPCAAYRHLYDGKTYSTCRLSDNAKLTGSIAAYITYYPYDVYPLDKASEKALDAYFGQRYAKPDLGTLVYAEKKILDKRLAARHKKETDIIDERMSHCSPLPDEFYSWVNDVALAKARYFFYNYDRKEQNGYCSHCRTRFAAKVRHGEKTICPHCGSELTAKALGRTTVHTIQDSVNVIYIEPIIEHGTDVLVERCFTAHQHISGHRSGAEEISVYKYFTENARYFYKADNELCLCAFDRTDEGYYNFCTYKQTGKLRWCNGSETYISASLTGYIYPGNVQMIAPMLKNITGNIDLAAIVPHVRTRLSYLCRALSEYPVAENFAKQGLYHLTQAVCDLGNGYHDYSAGLFKKAARLGELSPSKAFGMNKTVLAKLGNITVDEYLLYTALSDIGKIDTDTFKRFTDFGLDDRREETIAILKDGRIGFVRFINYLTKQKKASRMSPVRIFDTYYDYLSMVKELKMKRTDSVLFPQELVKEHDRVMKIKADRKYSSQVRQLKSRMKLLDKLCYDDGRFCVLPLRSPQDFLNESAMLSHCVKTYIDRCAKGETNIFGVRRSEAPDTPYFTLTLSNQGKVTQNLGKHNCNPPKEIKDFVDKWIKKVSPIIDEYLIGNKNKKARITA